MQRATRWQTSTCTELRSSSDLWRRPSRARNSTATWQTPLAASERADYIQTMLISLQGAEWHGTKLHTGLMCAGVKLSTVSTRSALCSTARGDLVIPRTRRRLGNRAFSVAGPAAWNSLPPDIRTASTLCSFKNLLKTHLFFLFISIIYLISRSVCCTAPL